MNKKQEALKMAIEALEYSYSYLNKKEVDKKALNACKEALEQQEQWQGLTDDEIARLVLINEIDKSGDTGFARLIEQALKEKNTHPAKQLSDDDDTEFWEKLQSDVDENGY